MVRIGAGWTTERRTKACISHNDDRSRQGEDDAANDEQSVSSSSSEEESIGAFAIWRSSFQRDDFNEWDPTVQEQDQGQTEEDQRNTRSGSLHRAVTDEEMNAPVETKIQLIARQKQQRIFIFWTCVALLIVMVGGGVLIGILLSRSVDRTHPHWPDEEGDLGEGSTTESLNNDSLGSADCLSSGSFSAQQEAPFDPFLDCQICDSIRSIGPELETLYYNTKEQLEIKTTDIPIGSCQPQNMALLWLATDSIEFSTPSHQIQRYVLAVLYGSFHGQNWDMARNWVSRDHNECDWVGVSCNSRGQIIGISLPKNSLEGEWNEGLVQTLSRLQRLQLLNFHDNLMRGQIPHHEGLVYLDLSQNLFSGFVDRTVNVMTGLQTLLIDGNGLTGGLPHEVLEQLTSLKTIDLSNNPELGGDLPETIGMLRELTSLEFSNTGIGGTIPSSIANLTSLQVLKGASAKLSGTLPDLSPLRNLRILELTNNRRLGGTLDAVRQLTSLQTLDLSLLSITGTIPSSFGDLQLLRDLFLAGNRLNGTIPTELGRIQGLEQVLLQENDDLSGTVPIELGSLAALGWLDIRLTNLFGTLEENFCYIPYLYRSCGSVECNCCQQPCSMEASGTP